MQQLIFSGVGGEGYDRSLSSVQVAAPARSASYDQHGTTLNQNTIVPVQSNLDRNSMSGL